MVGNRSDTSQFREFVILLLSLCAFYVINCILNQILSLSRGMMGTWRGCQGANCVVFFFFLFFPIWFYFCTLQDGHQASADARHNVIEQPLLDLVDPQPADDWQQGESSVLCSLAITPAETFYGWTNTQEQGQAWVAAASVSHIQLVVFFIVCNREKK